MQESISTPTLESPLPGDDGPQRKHRLRRVMTRGLAVVLPPLLTVVVLVWAGSTINSFVLLPAESAVCNLVAIVVDDSISGEAMQSMTAQGQARRVTGQGDLPRLITTNDGRSWTAVGNAWIPLDVFQAVERYQLESPPRTARGYYTAYIQHRYLKRYVVLPVFVLLFLLVLYFLGKFFAAGIGHFMWRSTEATINRIPLVSNIYSSLKQVSDFALSDRKSRFNRVVAVEYPRRGLWSLGFVTGDGLPKISQQAGEPTINVFIPTSPMPASGFTLCAPQSQVIDLDVSLDQAIQFILSCGVVTPGQLASRGSTLTLPDDVVSPEASRLES